MCERMRNLGICKISDINKKLQSTQLFCKQFNQFIEIYAAKQSSIKTIYQIVSKSLTKNLYSTPRVFKEDLIMLRKDLIIANSPTEGDI
jgi:DNA polymerase III alpha subunit (gram-positive type)